MEVGDLVKWVHKGDSADLGLVVEKNTEVGMAFIVYTIRWVNDGLCSYTDDRVQDFFTQGIMEFPNESR
tara:strand:+ start:24 stop:230 length:207 start_codon:yes stop_codon:yes gene_type:complete